MWSQAAVPQLLSKLEDPDLQAEVLSIAELKAFVCGGSAVGLCSVMVHFLFVRRLRRWMSPLSSQQLADAGAQVSPN